MAWWMRHLRCPACRISGLVGAGNGGRLACPGCGEEYAPTGRGTPDLRRERTGALPVVAGPPGGGLAQVKVGRPETTFAGASGWRAPAELLSVLAAAVPKGGAVLDAGCGGAAFRDPVVASLGLDYVGIDIADGGADLLADLHNVPFADGSFDAVVSYAVLGCCRSPEVAVGELARVLKPGGAFVATFSFLEPWVEDSHKITHTGLVDMLAAVGMRTERVWACRDALEALGSYIGPYPAVVKWGLRSLAVVARWDFLSPRRWRRESPAEREMRRLWTAGSLGVLGRREGPGEGEGRKA